MKKLKTLLQDFISLAFPDVCQACGVGLNKQEQVLCTYCLFQLPYTHFHLQKDNKTAREFWGRADIRAATSFLYFKKGERVQHLLHQLKYRRQTQIGVYLGRLCGKVLKQAGGFSGVDLICPLPLHKQSMRRRGYNQSEFFALGLGETMKKKVDASLLARTRIAESQTRKSRFDRFLNVREAFSVRHPHRLVNRHVLLVDDVLTTGATLTACASAVLAVGGTQVSIATIAYAP